MLFHFTQSIFRHLTELGSKRSYSKDPGLKKMVRMLMASAYLPEEQILPMFIQLCPCNFAVPSNDQIISIFSQNLDFDFFPKNVECYE